MPKSKNIRIEDDIYNALRTMSAKEYRKENDIIKEAMVIYLRANQYLPQIDRGVNEPGWISSTKWKW